MRFYTINLLSLSPIVLLLLVDNSVWSVLCVSVYVLFWLNDYALSTTPLYRNYPLIGRLHSIAHLLRNLFSDTPPPYSQGTLNVINSYANNKVHYSSFGKQTLPTATHAIKHVIFPKEKTQKNISVIIGGSSCTQKYSSAIFNISALSFGSITLNAIETLSLAAQKGNFYYNTGEAGIHQRAIDGKGDLVWQLGTGYFGCRDIDGQFNEDLYIQKANLPNVKMIEIKLSQGSKPALGGFLPASKVSQEVADLCGVALNKDSILPITHSAFDSVEQLPEFIQKLRSMSKGKPIGLKLCLGNAVELENLISSMKDKQIYPDFITVDSSNGGTGSAPSEYQDSVGMPLYPALAMIDQLLKKYGLREEVRVIASGKISVASDIFIALAHGADICVAARPFLIAMGCVQAMACESSVCPSGITSSHKWLDKAVQPAIRSQYLVNYQSQMIDNFAKLLSSAGLSSPSEISEKHLYKI